MADLVATVPIKVGFRVYEPGELLPADNPDAPAWVESGAAIQRSEDYQPSTWIKAKRMTAEPGLTGLASGAGITGEELVGRIPMTNERRRR